MRIMQKLCCRDRLGNMKEICAAETREEVESILKEDVYYAEGMAVYDVRPFKGIKISAHFAEYAGK